MKYIMFKNDSGDPSYPLCILDVNNPLLEEVWGVCKHLIGDDYDGENTCGTFSVEDWGNLPKFSDLIRYNTKG